VAALRSPQRRRSSSRSWARPAGQQARTLQPLALSAAQQAGTCCALSSLFWQVLSMTGCLHAALCTAGMCTRTHPHTHTRTHTHAHTRTHTCIHAHTYALTHAGAQRQQQQLLPPQRRPHGIWRGPAQRVGLGWGWGLGCEG